MIAKKTTRLLTTIVASAMLVVANIQTAPLAHAEATSQHIAMTPSSAEISLKPGERKEGFVSVVNQGTGAFDVALSVAPYHVAPDDPSYEPKFDKLAGTTDPSAWVSLATTSSKDLQPNAVVDVRYHIAAPATAAPGGYYAVVFAESTPVNVPESGVVAHNRVGQILYITVEGNVEQKGEISSGTTSLFVVGNTVRTDAIVKNTGGKHFKTEYKTTIRNLFGSEVYNDTKTAYVLPQTQRSFDNSWSTSALIGVYKISRSASLPDGTKTLSDVQVIVVQPAVVYGLIAALLIVASLWLVKRRKN